MRHNPSLRLPWCRLGFFCVALLAGSVRVLGGQVNLHLTYVISNRVVGSPTYWLGAVGGESSTTGDGLIPWLGDPKGAQEWVELPGWWAGGLLVPSLGTCTFQPPSWQIPQSGTNGDLIEVPTFVITGSQSGCSNQICLSVANGGAGWEYLQWAIADVTVGRVVQYGGCDSSLTFTTSQGTAQGPNGHGDGCFFALGPGQQVTVCGPAAGACGDEFVMCALSAPDGATPCSSGGAGFVSADAGGSLCVYLCGTNDFTQVGNSGNSVLCTSQSNNVYPQPQPGQTNLLGTNASPAPSLDSPTNVGQIAWGPTNSTGPWALDATVRTGFAVLDSDLRRLSNGSPTLEGTNFTSTNWPTNYPNAVLESNLAWMGSWTNGVVSNMSGWLLGRVTNVAVSNGTAVGESLSNVVAGYIPLLTLPEMTIPSSSTAIPLPKTFGGASLDIDFGVGLLPDDVVAVLAVVRVLLVWAMGIWLFVRVFDLTYKIMTGVLQQRQVSGSKESAFGWNAAYLTGAVYAAILVGVVAAFPVVAAQFMGPRVVAAVWGNGVAALSTTLSWPVVAVVNSLFPVPEALTALFDYLLWRYVFMFPVSLAARAIVCSLIE